MRRPEPFAMMHWAKQRAEHAPYCLGASGVAPPSEAEFPIPISAGAPFTSAGNYYGSPALREAIAKAYGVAEEAVLVSDGTSLANYTALSVLCGPGETVLVERPTYGTLESIPRFHGARVEILERRASENWTPSLDGLRARLDDHPVGLVVLTRLHNPSGANLDDSYLNELARLAESRGFRVLFDEVYLDFVEDATSAVNFSPRFVSTGSLTKAYGFGGLRVGWVLGDPALLEPMKEFSFYLAVNGSTWSQEVARRVVDERERWLARSRAIAAGGLEVVEEWLATRSDVDWTRPDGGLNAFVRLERVVDTKAFATHLFDVHRVAVAEGDFFGMPGWMRISFGIPRDDLAEALRRVGNALDSWSDG